MDINNLSTEDFDDIRWVTNVIRQDGESLTKVSEDNNKISALVELCHEKTDIGKERIVEILKLIGAEL